MNPGFRDRGVDYVCPICGHKGHVNDPDIWTLKRKTGHKKGECQTIYFDRPTCKWAYDDALEEAEKLRMESVEGDRCGICRYFSTDEYGFYDCSASAIVVNPGKKACRKFKEIVRKDI